MLNSGASRPLAHWFVCYNIYFAAPLLEHRLYGPTVQMCLPDILSRSLTSPSFLFQLFFRRFFHETWNPRCHSPFSLSSSVEIREYRVYKHFAVHYTSYSRSKKIGIIFDRLKSNLLFSFYSNERIRIPWSSWMWFFFWTRDTKLSINVSTFTQLHNSTVLNLTAGRFT